VGLGRGRVWSALQFRLTTIRIEACWRSRPFVSGPPLVLGTFRSSPAPLGRAWRHAALQGHSAAILASCAARSGRRPCRSRCKWVDLARGLRGFFRRIALRGPHRPSALSSQPCEMPAGASAQARHVESRAGDVAKGSAASTWPIALALLQAATWCAPPRDRSWSGRALSLSCERAPVRCVSSPPRCSRAMRASAHHRAGS